MSDFERKLAKDLSRGKEYRETYAEAFASEYTATQIQLQRKQRGWTQDELGRRIGSNQGRISVYEDEDYGKWSLDTLRKLASEFGLWLKVSFEAYSTLIHEVGHFAPANLVRSSFEQDAELRQWLEEDTPDRPDAKLRRMVERWAAAPEPDLHLLATWLQGFSLPGFNEREWTPAQYLLDTIPESDEKVWARLAGGVASIFRRDEEEYAALLRSPVTFRDNLFALARSIGPLPVIQDGLQAVYDRAMHRFEHTGMTGLGYEGDTGLLDAMIHNQADDRWKPIWFAYLRGRNRPEDFTEPGHPFLPGAWLNGMRGLLGLPKGENDYWLDIAKGIGDL
jgi:transcriptional regulator with XRE-family HTH domain